MCEWGVVCGVLCVRCCVCGVVCASGGANAHFRRFSVWQHRSRLLVIKNAALMAFFPLLPYLHAKPGDEASCKKHKNVTIEEIVFNTMDSITCTVETKLCKAIVL